MYKLLIRQNPHSFNKISIYYQENKYINIYFAATKIAITFDIRNREIRISVVVTNLLFKELYIDVSFIIFLLHGHMISEFTFNVPHKLNQFSWHTCSKASICRFISLVPGYCIFVEKALCKHDRKNANSKPARKPVSFNTSRGCHG